MPQDLYQHHIRKSDSIEIRASRTIRPTDYSNVGISRNSRTGAISESTLSKQLRKAGITRKKLQQIPNGREFRRFEFPYRNACWQGDV